MGTLQVNGAISATGTISASSFLGNASSATVSRFLSSDDTRNYIIYPNDMTASEAVHFDFKADSAIGLTDAAYSGVMSYRPYSSSSDWTGGPAHQLAFNTAGLYWRQSSGNSWLSWQKLLHSGNYTSYTVTKTGSGASGTWGINITGDANYATSSGYATSTSLKVGSANVARQVIFQSDNCSTTVLDPHSHDLFKYNPNNGYLYVPHGVFSNGLESNGGHLYLTGAYESSSTSNTSQIVFGTSSNNHVALSSNKNCLIINPTTSSTNGQIALYTDRMSKFPNGIDSGALNTSSITTGTITTSGTVTASVIKASSQLIGTLFLDNNGAYTAYGTPPPEGNITGVVGRVYFQI